MNVLKAGTRPDDKFDIQENTEGFGLHSSKSPSSVLKSVEVIASQPGTSAPINRGSCIQPEVSHAGNQSLTSENLSQVDDRIVRVRVSSEVQQYLNDDVRVLVDGIQAIAVSAAKEFQIDIDRIQVQLRYPRKDRHRNPILGVTIKTPRTVNPNQALALWDSIGLRIDRWRNRMGPSLRRLIDEKIFVSVEWYEN